MNFGLKLLDTFCEKHRLDKSAKEEIIFIHQALNKDIKNRGLTIEMIKNVVCEYFKQSGEDIFIKSKKNGAVYYRIITQYFCKLYNIATLSEIGESTGGQNYSTILKNSKTIQELITNPYCPANKKLANDIENVNKIIKEFIE